MHILVFRSTSLVTMVVVISYGWQPYQPQGLALALAKASCSNTGSLRAASGPERSRYTQEQLEQRGNILVQHASPSLS